MNGLQHKVALVTGASRGIGKAIAKDLSQQGATVIGTATTEQGAEKITSYLQENKNKGIGLTLDVTDTKSVENALTQILSFASAPNIVINNAGITEDNLFLRMQENAWEKVIDANLTGSFRVIKACLRPMLKARWGRIINISSVVAVTGNSGQANYAAAKAGMLGFSKSLAQEVASRGITVNVIAPGFINTDMTKKLTELQHTNLLEQIPMKRMGTPEDIAFAVRFLVSTGANYINWYYYAH